MVVCEFFVVFFVVFVVVEFVGEEGGEAGLGEVDAVGGALGGADQGGGVGPAGEAASVDGGDGEPVEQGGGAFDVELAGGQGVDDDGERELDGFAVFERGELDVLAGDEVAAGLGGVTEAAVARVETGVEEAVGAVGERGRLALQAGGLVVAAECLWHFGASWVWGYGG